MERDAYFVSSSSLICNVHLFASCKTARYFGGITTVYFLEFYSTNDAVSIMS